MDEGAGGGFTHGGMDGEESSVLLAIGGDSAIELVSATIVLWRFRRHEISESAMTGAELVIDGGYLAQ